jgi:hypothetical protein
LTANLVRALRDAERADLAKERRALAWRAALLALSVPFAFAASLAIGAVGIGMLPMALKPLGVAPVLAGIVGGAALALTALDFLRRRARISLDLARGEVLGFEGHTRAAVSERMRMVLGREGFPVDGGLSVAFEILSATGRLWSVGDARSHSWMLLPVQTPAAIPEHAARAADWVKPVASIGGATLLGRTRPLSYDERAEIASLQRRVVRKAARGGLFVAITLALVLPGALRAHAGGLRVAAIVVCAFVLVTFGRSLAADVRLVRKLARDRAGGLVQIVRMRAADGDAMSPATEILPRSGVAWTQMGEPAPWRRGSGAEIARG